VEIADEVVDAAPVRTSNRGGKRPGAGRKPAGYVKPPEKTDYDDAKARHETAKAALAELDLAKKAGEQIPRDAVRQACATAISSFAQTLRSVPDNLERRLALAPEVCEAVGEEIDAALDELATALEMMVEKEFNE
jgi:phage terminase Nu1 subunit (DNA packaging protein)